MREQAPITYSGTGARISRTPTSDNFSPASTITRISTASHMPTGAYMYLARIVGSYGTKAWTTQRRERTLSKLDLMDRKIITMCVKPQPACGRVLQRARLTLDLALLCKQRRRWENIQQHKGRKACEPRSRRDRIPRQRRAHRLRHPDEQRHSEPGGASGR